MPSRALRAGGRIPPGVGHQRRVDRVADPARAADDLGLGQAFLGAPGDVGAGRRVRAHPGDHDPPQRVVGLPVAAAVKPVPGHLARGGRDRRGRAQVRPGRLGPPMPSRAAATWLSAWVSTPPVTAAVFTMVMVIPFVVEGWHAPAGRRSCEPWPLAQARHDRERHRRWVPQNLGSRPTGRIEGQPPASAD